MDDEFKKLDLTKTDKPNSDNLSEEESQTGSILLPKINLKKKVNENSEESPKKKRKVKKAAKATLFVLILLLIAISYVGLLLFNVYQNSMMVKASVESLYAAAIAQDMEKIKSEIGVTKTSLGDLKQSYNKIVWMRGLPLMGNYISDGKHAIQAGEYGLEAGEIITAIIEPYADIIGFTGTQGEAENQTAQDRLDFVVKTIPDVIPKADLLIEKVSLIRDEVDEIDPNRYPEEIFDRPLRSQVAKGVEIIDIVAETIIQGKPLLESAPYLMGVDAEREYLVLFQNDKELRPTGGFLTAYSIAKVEKGKFEPVNSDDIYNLDSKYKPTIAAPEPIIKYLKGPYIISRKFRLRDINWSPDFYESMKTFSEESTKVGLKGFDGIIAVDTQLLVNLLNVIGPVDVPGYGKYSTEIIPECNCPQVIYELESFADIEGPVVWSENTGEIVFAPPNMDNRKKIIGPLMNSILSHTLGQPKEKMPALIDAAYKSLMEKHVLFYMVSEEHQKAVESFKVAGRIDGFEGDYLHINDANLGGRKSNLYVTQEVSQEISVASDGSVEKTLTITYKNPAPYDGWLNSVLPNYVRVYVPKGSELVSSEGLEEKFDVYEEFGKSVFAGYFQLRPQGVAKVTFKYKLPFKAKSGLSLLIQKQPGTGSPLYTISMGKNEEEFFLTTDKELKLR